MRYNLITLDLFLCASKYKSLVKAAKEKNIVANLPAPIIPIVIGFDLLFNKLKRFITYP